MRRALARFARSQRGVAAVEFALLLPVMLTLYMGSVELTQALTADRRVVLLTRTLGDLTTQSTTLNATDLAGIVAAASSVLAPMPTGVAKIRLTSVAISSSGSNDPKVPNKASVCWSYQQNWSATTRGTLLDTDQVPMGLRQDVGTSIIIAEVQYPYKPVVGYVFKNSFTLTERLYMRPRLSTYVARTDVTANGIPSPTTGPCL